MNPTKQLGTFGQSLWLDYMHRELITTGKLQSLIDEDGLRGLTSNPTIFQKTLAEGTLYDASIQQLLETEPEITLESLFETLAIQDLQMAADIFRPVYDKTKGDDGFVSIEVSPRLAYDARASIEEAHRLWEAVNRPNLMVKIPATPQGMEAIETLTAQGINVNVTLIFAVAQYESVVEAFLRGLKQNPDPAKIRSVASFFVSRVDTAVDRALDESGTPDALALKGKVAIINARLAYRRFRQVFFEPYFEDLREKGAQVQRPLWASTGTKNKAYSDVLYVEQLIGPDTVISVPPATLDAFRDHGHVKTTLTTNIEEAQDMVNVLRRLGINLSSIGQALLMEGVDSFNQSYDQLLASLQAKKNALLTKAA